jgi:hypothetical protein
LRPRGCRGLMKGERGDTIGHSFGLLGTAAESEVCAQKGESYNHANAVDRRSGQTVVRPCLCASGPRRRDRPAVRAWLCSMASGVVRTVAESEERAAGRSPVSVGGGSSPLTQGAHGLLGTGTAPGVTIWLAARPTGGGTSHASPTVRSTAPCDADGTGAPGPRSRAPSFGPQVVAEPRQWSAHLEAGPDADGSAARRGG